jgi:hypothetical protein
MKELQVKKDATCLLKKNEWISVTVVQRAIRFKEMTDLKYAFDNGTEDGHYTKRPSQETCAYKNSTNQAFLDQNIN